ncbi:MAG: NAD(P)/FAD-dependent oxidoreductase [Bacilli bacterium]|nr:NAD(P)/FAD-dependent oxidoreductase [Bacilli bacterium]
MENKDLVIIGGGSAGMAAAIGAYNEGIRDILILEKGEFLGGILNQCIHNGFGLTEFKEELTGPEFASRFIEQVKEKGIEFKLHSFVTDISKDKVITYTSKEEGVVMVQAKAIVMAAGCYERNAGAIGIPGDRPAGVLTAGQAQLFLNEYGYMTGKKVFILGSGDIGLIMARRLTLEGAKVLGVAEICAWSNGLNRNMVQCLEDYGIPLYLSHTVSKVIGKGRLEKIVLSKVDDKMQPIPGTEKEFEVDTLILSIGLLPNNDLLNHIGIPTSRSRGSLVNDKLETCVPGIFSCGNVLHVHDLVDNVVEEAREAGKNAAIYLKGEEKKAASEIEVIAGDGIGYVVPGKISLDENLQSMTFKFRVRKPSKNVYIQYEQNGNVIKKVLKTAIIPSEMEIQKLPREKLVDEKSPITIKMVAKEM